MYLVATGIQSNVTKTFMPLRHSFQFTKLRRPLRMYTFHETLLYHSPKDQNIQLLSDPSIHPHCRSCLECETSQNWFSSRFFIRCMSEFCSEQKEYIAWARTFYKNDHLLANGDPSNHVHQRRRCSLRGIRAQLITSSP